jgi:hypothetical protein
MYSELKGIEKEAEEDWFKALSSNYCGETE